VRDGAVEGWMWGPGSVTEAPSPPPVTFAEICPLEAASETSALSDTTGLTGSVSLTATATTTITPAAAPASEAAAESGGAQWGGLLLAVLPLPLLVIGYLIWRRRQ
jgi:hypothetical protein